MGCAGRRGLSKRKIAIWVPRAEIRADTPARGPLFLALLYHSRLHLSIVNFNKKRANFHSLFILLKHSPQDSMPSGHSSPHWHGQKIC